MAGANRTPKIQPIPLLLARNAYLIFAVLAYISTAIISRPARLAHLFHTAHHAFGHLGDLVVHYCAYWWCWKSISIFFNKGDNGDTPRNRK